MTVPNRGGGIAPTDGHEPVSTVATTRPESGWPAGDAKVTGPATMIGNGYRSLGGVGGTPPGGGP